MAKLTETEKAQLRRPLPPLKRSEPAPRIVPARSFLEFAKFANRFSRSSKPVRFAGDHWKL